MGRRLSTEVFLMHRRSFLKASAATALTLTTGTSGWSWAARSTGHHPIGLQLFTVMSALEKDFEGTLQAVAKIGYKEVETIGAFGRDPKYVRSVLDRYGLVSPSQHLVPGNLYQLFSDFVNKKVEGAGIQKQWQDTASVENMRATVEEGIERAKILGQKYVVLQIIWPDQMATRELVEEFCKALNLAGELCAKAGLVFNFHNHDLEMKPVNGYVPYDLILQNTDPKTVKMEMDLFWVAHAGQNPLEYLAKHPGRYVQFHLKDSTPSGDFTTVGKGVLKFPELIAAGRKAGVKHFYVEYDRSDDPLKETKESFEYLRSIM
jgi:sugar phosphate isomerase/epimerase